MARTPKSKTRLYSIHAVTREILACHGELSDESINAAIDFYVDRQRLANEQAIEIGNAPTAHEPIHIITHRTKKPPHAPDTTPYLRNGVTEFMSVVAR